MASVVFTDVTVLSPPSGVTLTHIGTQGVTAGPIYTGAVQALIDICNGYKFRSVWVLKGVYYYLIIIKLLETFQFNLYTSTNVSPLLKKE